MANHQLFKELDVERKPADAVTRKPAERQTWEVDIDASQTTVLRQAVLWGRADWVHNMLNMGADPLLEGKDGRRALEVAEEMVSKYPEVKGRRELLDLVQSSVKCGGWRSRKFLEVVGEVKDLIGKLEEGLAGILSFKESTNDALNSISTKVNANKLKAVDNEPTEEDTLLQASTVRVQEHADFVATVDAILQSMKNVTREQAGVISSINSLQLTIEDGKKEQANLVSKADTTTQSQEEMKGDIRSIKQSLSALHNDCKKSLEDVKVEMKQPLEEIKVEVKATKRSYEEMKDIVYSMRQSLVGLKGALRLIGPSSGAVEDRGNCIEAMMRRTKVMSPNKAKESKMRELYEILYDTDPTLSSILQFLRLQRVEVHVDFDEKHIGRMKSTNRDHDGREWNGRYFTTLANFEELKAYVSVGGWYEVSTIANLAHALSQLSVFLAFQNKGRPYLEDGDGERESEFKGILEEARGRKRDDKELHWSIRGWTLDMKTQIGKEIQLSAAVPIIIAREGSSEGRSILNGQLPSLLKYYDEHVVATLRRKTMEVIARECAALL